MSTEMSHQIADERRASLAAERVLEQRHRELRDANHRLEAQARALTEQILAKRAEHRALVRQNDALRSEHDALRAAPGETATAQRRSEERLWQALQSIRDGFALFGPDHRLIVANDAYLSVFDGLAEAAPGLHYDAMCDILVEEGIVDTQGPADAWLETMKSRWRTETIPNMTVKLWNGQVIELIDRTLPDGGIVTLAMNQTEILRLRAAIDAIPDGFMIFDRNDRLVLCNESFRRVHERVAGEITLGTTYAEMLRRAIDEQTFHDLEGREAAWIEDRMNLHLNGGGVRDELLSDGTWIRAIDSETPDGGRVSLRIDTTSIKRQQEELEQARQAAEAASRAKSAFLANMSHEIRTPMNGLVGMANLLLETELDASQQVVARTMEASANALLTFLNDVLDYARLGYDDVDIAADPFDLEETIVNVLRVFEPEAEAKSLDLGIDYDFFLPTRFIGDHGRVRRVLANIVGNAVKFTACGHILVAVTGDPLEGNDGWNVRITIEDTGIGIPADMAEHVFGSFNQVETDADRGFDGAGLGLSIGRRLVELMGGEIWLDTEIETGAGFGIALPLAVAPPAAGPVDMELPDGTCHIAMRPGLTRQILARQTRSLGLDVRDGEGLPATVGPADTIFAGDAVLSAADPAHLAELAASARLVALDDGSPRSASSRAVLRRIDQPVRGGAVLDALFTLPEPQAGPRSGHRVRVLAAEDNATNQMVLKMMLKRFDIDLRIVPDGAAAVDAVRADPPDLVLMDISMPTLDGKEATRLIRAWEAEEGRAPLPIVAMTAHALSGDEERILAAGLDHVMAKPLSVEGLAVHIDRAAADRASDPSRCSG